MKSIQIKLTEQGVSTETLLAVQSALDQVNGKAEAFTITFANKLVEIVKRAEHHLDQHDVVLSDRPGATVTYRPAGPSAKAYKYSAVTTEITLRRARAGTPVWHLDEVRRVDVYPRNAERFHVRISDAAARNLIKRTLAAFGRTDFP